MEINAHRRWFTNSSTTSEVFYSADEGPKTLACYALEDGVRAKGVKIFGKTAIPTGTYRVLIRWSARFKQMMPALVDVPGFEGVLIHWGNTDEDTDGCLLLGKRRDSNMVLESRLAFEAFCNRFCEALNKGEQVTLTIHGAPEDVR